MYRARFPARRDITFTSSFCITPSTTKKKWYVKNGVSVVTSDCKRRMEERRRNARVGASQEIGIL